MKFKKEITILVLIIIVFSIIASAVGIFSGGGNVDSPFPSLWKNDIELYGKGLYKYDSKSYAAQAIGQDIVTLFIAIPLLIGSLILARKDLMKGKLLLTGTLGYFLYTYTSYSFLCQYNAFFLIYVLLMSTSLFTFILSIMAINVERIKMHFKETLPTKFISIFIMFIGVVIGMMWLGLILPSLSLKDNIAPDEIDHYTTLVIQAMDLGFIVPTAFLTGFLLLKKRPFGYLLSSIVIIKGATMFLALDAMILNMVLNGVHHKPFEIIIFPIFTLVCLFAFYVLFKNIKEKAH